MNCVVSYVPDPQLEELRSSVAAPPLEDLTKEAEEWADRGASLRLQKIIGDDAAFKMCVVIKRFIDGTPLDVNGNWEDFARCLGLDRWTIQRLDNFKDVKGPTGAVLNEFASLKHGTVDVLIKALLELERFDILQEISPLVNDVLQLNGGVPRGNDSTPADEDMDSGIYHSTTFTGGPAVNDNVEAAAASQSSETKKKKRRKLVMLTFAVDGREKAFKVAEALQRQKLKVLLLEGNMDQLTEDPWMFVHKCFGYVDYIVPIITKGYLAQISPGQERGETLSITHPDALYLHLIFNLMCAEYMNDGCKNYRVRAVFDEEVIRLRSSYTVLKLPFFFTYHRVEEAEHLGRCLAKSKAQRPGYTANQRQH